MVVAALFRRGESLVLFVVVAGASSARRGARFARGLMRKPLRAVALIFGLGLTLAVTTAAGALLGDYLDRRWGTGPWLSLMGTLLGMGLGLWQVLSEARRVDGGR